MARRRAAAPAAQGRAGERVAAVRAEAGSASPRSAPRGAAELQPGLARRGADGGVAWRAGERRRAPGKKEEAAVVWIGDEVVEEERRRSQNSV